MTSFSWREIQRMPWSQLQAGLVLSVAAVWWFNWRSARLAAFDGEMQIASLALAKYPEIQRRAGKL
jgi:hypothetical protein